MIKKPERGLFVTGTNTEVGKTFVACLIARALCEQGHRVGVYKPAVSGSVGKGDEVRWDDVELLWGAAGKNGENADVCPQRFHAPLAPHLAARAEGREMDEDLLRTGLAVWADKCDIVIVEGAGGLMSPMSDDDYVADLAFEFGYPLVVVAPNELGVINQTLQTLITAATFRDGLPIAGVVLNDLASSPNSEAETKIDASVDTNYNQLVQRCGPPVLSHLPFSAKSFEPKVDWYSLTETEHAQ